MELRHSFRLDSSAYGGVMSILTGNAEPGFSELKRGFT